MDYEKYMSLIRDGKAIEAAHFKSKSMPERFYKYVSLNDDDSLNEKKFNTLRQNELHMDSFETYNDPFEGTFFLFDEKKLSTHGWKYGLITDLYNSLVKGFKICSLSATSEQNMPMWAYYANNHKGYCLEYIFTETQRKYIFPVVYENERQEATSILANMVNDELNVIMQNPGLSAVERVDLTSDITSETNLLIFLSIAAKHLSWQHEKEYRIIADAKHDSFPAIATKIYAGLNCKNDHIQKLCSIAKDHAADGIPTEMYKMKFDAFNKAFRFTEERVC